MVISIGTDIVAVSRIAGVCQRHPEAFPRRILHDQELQRFHDRAGSAATAYLAKRFAAKEAISKALRCGIGAVSWRDLCVLNDAAGAPLATLYGAARERLRAMGGQQVHISLADERDYVVAFAVIDSGS